MKMRNSLLLLISSIMIFIIAPLSAQMNYEGLIFSEVYLDESRPEQSWLEIYNPTSEPLVLLAFRFYHIKSTNILPQEIIDQGGIEVPANGCIVLCANSAGFDASNDKDFELIQVREIRYFNKGGFFSLSTKDMGEDGIDVLRYGNPESTSKLEDDLGDFIIPFSEDNISYSRVKNNNMEKPFRPNFIKSKSSPGQYSVKEAGNE